MFESVCRTLKTICIHGKCVQVCITNRFRDSGWRSSWRKGGGNFSQISRNARYKKKKEISKEMWFLVRRNNITDLFMNRVRLELNVKSSIFYLRKILDSRVSLLHRDFYRFILTIEFVKEFVKWERMYILNRYYIFQLSRKFLYH